MFAKLIRNMSLLIIYVEEHFILIVIMCIVQNAKYEFIFELCYTAIP